MPDAIAKEIIALRDREKARQANFRNLWQSVADLMFPQTFPISTVLTPGGELMTGLFDSTAVEEGENMASGITNNLFPAGQRFFSLSPAGDARDNKEAENYLYYLTEKAHEHIANSNFQAQVSNTIHYWLMFGTGCLYVDYDPAIGLYYRDYAIGTFQCMESASGIIDSIIFTMPLTARQIVEKWGNDEEKVGKSVIQALERPDSENQEFSVIHVIQPRRDFDANPNLRVPARDPWASIFVQEKDAVVLENGGFDEFPFAVPRYQVIYREVYGRGRGTMLLPQVRVLNRLAKDYMEMSNKWVNPPLEVLDTFDGIVDVTPGAINHVTQMQSIRGVDYTSRGAYPVTKDILEYNREAIRQGFFKNAFEALTPLSGDRRTTTEIIERLKEGMKKLNKPIGRLFTELLEPIVNGSIKLLIQNGQVQRPPMPISAKIEFVNPLALALRDQQSRGLQYWVMALGEMEAIFPGVKDNCDYDEAARDLGRALGVKATHLRDLPERDKLRKQRQEQLAQQQQLAAMEAMGKTYNQGTKSPEGGSPASKLMGGD